MCLHSRSVPFGKEELSAILKFGAEELFKEGDDSRDKELQVCEGVGHILCGGRGHPM